eukprot:SRR837773.8074.p1 GENE.SRR837773.8074~~SRR837773.8074.p1  ORF type:complete len:236 (+),score=54.22 SRR837773.8074:29-709(+)
MEVKVMTYNLFWWNLFGQRRGNGGSAGRLIRESTGTGLHDFMGFQECDDPFWPLKDAGLMSSYEVVRGGHACAMAYRKDRWTLLSQGQRDVGEDRREQYYGKRGVHWGRFQEKQNGRRVLVLNFHGPLPVGTGGAYGGAATANNIKRVIEENSQAGDAVVMVGDFNSNQHTELIRNLRKHLSLVYTGRSHGGVDHVLSSCGSEVLSTRNLGTGGSDHDALDVTMRL